MRDMIGSKPRFKAMWKNGTINGIKGSREIKKAETSDLLFARGSYNEIGYSEESSFSRMKFSVGGLVQE